MDTAGSERAGIERMGAAAGECEVVDGKLGGIAVNTGARIAALGDPARSWGPPDRRRPGLRFGSNIRGSGNTPPQGRARTWQLFAVQ